MSSPTRVFISYSHDSAEHKARVLELANRLRENGVDCDIDQFQSAPQGGWAVWTMRMIEDAELVLVVCTEPYARRFEGREKPGKGRGASWEGGVILQQMYDAQSAKFIPVALSADDEPHVPLVLQGQPRFVLDSDEHYWDLYRRLTNQPAVRKADLGDRVALPPKVARSFQGAGAGVGRSQPRLNATWVAIAAGALALIILAVVLRGRVITSSSSARDQAEPDGHTIHDGTGQVMHSHAKVVPLALHHTIDSAKGEFYWLKIRIKNPSPGPKTMTVTCEVTSSPRPFDCVPQKVDSRTIGPKGEETQILTPRLQPVNDRIDVRDDNTRVRLQWEVRDELDQVLDSHAYDVLVAPRNVFYWSLATPEGGTVGKDFLLASLSAWMRSVPPNTPRDLVTARFERSDDFIKQAYAKLFSDGRGNVGVALLPSMPEFPPSDYLTVLTPEEVISGRRANGLEAALLLAAVAKAPFTQSGVRLALITVARAAAEAQRVYLAWYEDLEKPWHGIELTRPQSFGDNLTSSSRQLETLITAEAKASLSSKGVYIRESGALTVLDFRNAQKKFLIQDLP